MVSFCSIITFNHFGQELYIYLAALLVLLVLSALSSGARTALSSLSAEDMTEVHGKFSRSHRAILKLLSAPACTSATVLAANTLLNITIIVISDRIIDFMFTLSSFGWKIFIKIAVISALILLVGEIMPKIFATNRPLRLARMTAPLMVAFRHLLRPLTYLMVKAGQTNVGKRRKRRGDNISIDQLSEAIEMTSDQSAEEKKILTGIVSLSNTEVEEIMRPRVDITAINVDEGYDRVREIITSSGFSRIPAFRENLDNIEGILYVKDMLPYLNADDCFEWHKHLRPAYYVPQHKKINELLTEFRSEKVHIALVVDEYGATLGLVSLEDVIEEIVGDITDESDVEEDFFVKTGEKTYIFKGKTHITDLVEVTGLAADTFDQVKGEAETIAGLMLEAKCDFLRQGDQLEICRIRFTAQRVEGRRIVTVKVQLP